MAWVHDSGYGPAYDHEGYPVAIQVDGSETPSNSAATGLEVIGWRSGCDCGWRGMQFYPRREWSSTSAAGPDGVNGWETGTGAFAEWERHLNRTLPELAVHDLAQHLTGVEDRLVQACQVARFAGLTWARIRAVAQDHPSVETLRRVEIGGGLALPLRSNGPGQSRREPRQLH